VGSAGLRDQGVLSRDSLDNRAKTVLAYLTLVVLDDVCPIRERAGDAVAVGKVSLGCFVVQSDARLRRKVDGILVGSYDVEVGGVRCAVVRTREIARGEKVVPRAHEAPSRAKRRPLRGIISSIVSLSCGALAAALAAAPAAAPAAALVAATIERAEVLGSGACGYVDDWRLRRLLDSLSSCVQGSGQAGTLGRVGVFDG